jgi:hypothetical protein
MAAALGCAEDANGTDTVSGATVCTLVGTSTWSNQSIPEQTGRFHVELYATPSAANIDGVIGLSNGPQTTWVGLGAIVRFAPNGYIDARAGSDYRADVSMPYEAGTTYWVRFDVDVVTHQYSVWVGSDPSHKIQVARDYPFRTEQSSVTRLSNLSSFVNPETGPGTLQVCGVNTNRDAMTADGCLANDASNHFVSYAVAPGINTMIVDVGARASIANMDGVFGIAQGEVDAYNDLAASIRFWTNGLIEARDGDTYRADVVRPYDPGVTYKLKFVVDIANKTYSVFLNDPRTPGEAVELATGYHFRPQQAGVTTLDHVATVVASTTGHIDACDPRNVAKPELQFAREGSYWMAPMPDDGMIVAGGVNIGNGPLTRLDANGKVIATSSIMGGPMAADDAGNISVATWNYEASTVTVSSYTSTFALRWSRTIPANGYVQAIGIASNHWTYLWAGTQVLFVTEAGFAAGTTQVHWDQYGSDRIAIGGGGFVRSHWTAEGTTLTAYGITGAEKWTHYFPGNFEVHALAMGPDGSVVAGGEFFADINFGDRTMTTATNDNGARNAFVLALDDAGNFRFSERLIAGDVHYVATNGNSIVTSNQDWSQATGALLTTQVFDTAGHHIHDWVAEGFGLARNGNSYDVYMTASGRIFASLAVGPLYPTDGATGGLFLTALKP